MNTSSSSHYSRAVLAGRLVLVAAAAAALVAAFARRAPEAARSASGAATVAAATAIWACPMHPEVSSPSAGDCPICRMALERTARPVGLSEPATFSLTDETRLRAFDSVSLVKPYKTSLEMRGHAWVADGDEGVARYHTDESKLVQPGETGLFFPLTRPRDGARPGIEVRILPGQSAEWDESTRLVRFRATGAGRLSPGQTGSLKLASRVRHDLVVRAGAIVRSADGPHVLVVSADRKRLTKRPISVGNVLYGYAAITAGLQPGELVAAKRTFLLDAERRLGGRPGL
jgi:hypothetical protein